MTNPERKQRHLLLVSRPLENAELFLGPPTCKCTSTAILQTSREWAPLKKECPTTLPRQNRKSRRRHPGCYWHCCKQVKGKIPAKKINALVHTLSIISTLSAQTASWNVWKKMIRKRRKPNRKVLGLDGSASLLHPEKPTARASGKASCWSPFPRIHGIMGMKK